MPLNALKDNIKHMKEVVREINVFTNQLDTIKNMETGFQVVIESREKVLLASAIIALTNQLIILNNSIPELINSIGIYKSLTPETKETSKIPTISTRIKEKLIQVKYKPADLDERVSLTISDKDRKSFIENLRKSNLSITKLKKKYSTPKPQIEFGKPNAYAKMSNKFFRKSSNKLVAKGYFARLNRDLRKMNSPFVLGTYISMVLFSITITFILSIFLVLFLLFINISFSYPFLTAVKESMLLRFTKTFWLMIAVPLLTGLLLYFYPSTEAKNLGSKITQELPFVSIHMSAIATSGIEPTSIFKILLKSKEYKYTNIEFRKLMNLVNFHGKNLVTALKEVSKSSPSPKLGELLNGLATATTSGGNLHDYLNKHAEGLLFDYRLQREKSTRNAETFMDIYIAVVIAAPMILMLLFVIMGSLGPLGNFLGLSTNTLSFLIILIIILLNIIFLALLKIKQPGM